MRYEGKCRWGGCPSGRDCEMSPAVAVPAGHRCKGRPRDGWGALSGGRQVSDVGCQLACLEKSSCKFALYNTKTRKCSYFEVCAEYKAQAGFVTSEKQCRSSESSYK